MCWKQAIQHLHDTFAACVHWWWTNCAWSHDRADPRATDACQHVKHCNCKNLQGSSRLTSAPVLSEWTTTFLPCNSFWKLQSPRLMDNNSKPIIWLSPLPWNFFISTSGAAQWENHQPPSTSKTAPRCGGYPRASQNSCAGGELGSCQGRSSLRPTFRMWHHHCSARRTSTSNCPLRRRFWSKIGLQGGAGKSTDACRERRSIPQHGTAKAVKKLGATPGQLSSELAGRARAKMLLGQRFSHGCYPLASLHTHATSDTQATWRQGNTPSFPRGRTEIPRQTSTAARPR